jgi:UPF0716 protein FxsA
MGPAASQSRVKWLIFALLALPAAELVTFIAVSVKIGLGPALLAIVAISLLGVMLLRHQGRSAAASIRLVMNGQRISTLDLSNTGLHRWLAALLLLVPGFITGALGGLLLIAPVRRGLAALIGRHLSQGVSSNKDPSIVDLPEEDWRVVPQDRIEQRHNDIKERK